MRNYIIGTSGHIDHGKTSIIKELTGIDTDRLKEEKEKGISIDIGFSYVDFEKHRIGIIDIPGHEKFIKNMLAGASGVDVCLFIVAADDGIMPQTKEHFDILNLLNIKSGIIVLNKCDRVDSETIKLRKVELKEFTKNSFLENANIIETSIYDSDSIKKLKLEIKNTLDIIEENQIGENIFRMPIDRSFTLNGIGNIVTGTTMGKDVKVKDKLEILPQKTIVTVKNIQSHGENKELLGSNNRCALNINFNEKINIERGNVIATPNMLNTTSIIDVEIKCLDNIDNEIKNGQRVRVYHLANEIMARVKLLNCDSLKSGEVGYAQLMLEKEIIALNLDLIIIRSFSPLVTIGGGTILNVRTKSVKRYNKEYIDFLVSKTTYTDENRVEEIIMQESKNFLTVRQLEPLLASIPDYLEIINNNLNKHFLNCNDSILHVKYYNELKIKISNYLSNFHKENPYKIGENISVVRRTFFENAKINLANFILKEMEFKIMDNEISLKDFHVKLSEEEEIVKILILKNYKREGFQLNKVNNIKDNIKNKSGFDNVFTLLVKDKTLIRVENDLFMLNTTLNEIINYIQTKDVINLSDLREFTNTGRKNVIALLEYCDRNKITRRVDNYREVIK
ncbi:MAG: selenocysteine-specific translation elongation factor [Bacilli bacterium]